jgi:hypothetical protein
MINVCLKLANTGRRGKEKALRTELATAGLASIQFDCTDSRHVMQAHDIFVEHNMLPERNSVEWSTYGRMLLTRGIDLDDAKLTLVAVPNLTTDQVLTTICEWRGGEAGLSAAPYTGRDIAMPAAGSIARCRLLNHLLQAKSPIKTLEPFIRYLSFDEITSAACALARVLDAKDSSVLMSGLMNLEVRYAHLVDSLAFSDSGATGDMVADCVALLQRPDGLKNALAMVAVQGSSQILASDGHTEMVLSLAVKSWGAAAAAKSIRELNLPKLYSHAASLSGTTHDGIDLEGANPEVILLGRAQQLLNQSNVASISQDEAARLKALGSSLVRATFKSMHRTLMNYLLRDCSQSFPTDIVEESVRKWAQSEFAQAIDLSTETGGRASLVPVVTQKHAAYFGISSTGDGTVLVTYYNLGKGAIDLVSAGDSNFIAVGKTPLQQFRFTIDSPEWDRFQRESARLMVDCSSGDGRFLTFKHYVAGLPDSIRTPTVEQFRMQKVGNCTFKGISAFLKGEMGSGYGKFREAETQAYSRALPETQKEYYSGAEFKSLNKRLVACSCLPAREFTMFDGCTPTESSAIRTGLGPLRRRDADARLTLYLTDYYDRRRTKCNSKADVVELFSQLHLSGRASLSDIADAVWKIIENKDQLFQILLKVPVPLKVIFRDPAEVMSAVYSVAPHKDPAFKGLLTLVRSGLVDDVARTFSSMDSEEKAKRLNAGGGYLATELRRYCPDIADGIIDARTGPG